MLRFKDLSKSFGRKQVIRDATNALGAGIYALQGANGSGKSTLLALSAGAIAPDAGEVWVDGVSLKREPVEARRRLAYAPDESPVYPFVTGCDLLDLVAKSKQCAVNNVVMELADEFNLNAHLSTRFDAMSLGTQKKFLLCATWIGDAPVMLFDEPSNGLDHAARAILARRIAERPAKSLTLFASHDAAFIHACSAQVLQISELLSG